MTEHETGARRSLPGEGTGMSGVEELAEQLAGAVEALEMIDREARVIVLNDDDAQARHQRIADLAHDALAALGGQ